MTRLLTAALTACVMIFAGAAFAETTAFPINSSSKWYTVTGDGMSSGSGCSVKAVASGQVIGTLDTGSKILSFGSDAKVITFAFNGSLAFIPVTAATELYPTAAATNQFRGGGATLEDQAKANKEKAMAAKGKPMNPGFTNQPTPTPQAGQAAGGRNGSGMPAGGRPAGRGGQGGGAPGSVPGNSGAI